LLLVEVEVEDVTVAAEVVVVYALGRHLMYPKSLKRQ
jgi:hypothetical protein